MSGSVQSQSRIPFIGQLRVRLILFAVLAVALPTGLFIRHAAMERRALVAEAEAQVQRLSRSWADRQNEVLEQASAMLDAAGRIQAIHDLDPVGCDRVVHDIARHHSWILGLSVIAKDGSLECSSDADTLPDGPLAAWSFLDDIETARSLTISEFVRPKSRMQEIYFAGVPLTNGKRFEGSLVVALDPSWLGDASSRAGLAPSLESIVIDRFGHIVDAQPTPGGDVAKRLPHSLVSRLSIESEGVSIEPDPLGVARIYTFRQIPSTGAKLVMDLARDDVVGAEDRGYSQTLLLLAAVAGLAVMLAAVGAEYVIFRWIDLLTNAANRIGNGNSPKLEVPRSAGEFSILAQAFNLMSARLKSRQQALADSEARFRDIAEVSGDWFWERDAEFRLTYVSERFAASTGIPPDLLFGQTLEEHKPSALFRRSPGLDAVVAAFAARIPFRDQLCRIRRPDGETRWWRLSGKPIFDAAGGFVGYRGSGSDATAETLADDELRNSEAKLRAALTEAEAANTAKRDFLATMSHELRTPLNAIIGFSKIMLDQMLGPMGNEQYLDYARDVHQSGQHLLSLINGILDLSRVEAGQLQLDEGPVDVTDVARFSAGILGDRATEAGVALTCHTDEALPPVMGDETQIRQIVINLVSNAIKFTPAGGTVTLSTAQNPKGDIEIEVRDTGIGIAPENIAHVFDPFFQVDSGLSRTLQEGMGLGLPLARRLAELHGGAIALESTVGIGTIVTVTLPAMQAAQLEALATHAFPLTLAQVTAA